MRAKSQIQNPDEVEVTLTLTTTLREWKRLDKQLPVDWPSMHLKQAISGLIINAERAGLIDITEPEPDHA
jgi:hypothetical protein